MTRPRKPAVVAELGRPETPEEASIRRDEARRNRRARQTTFNLVVATLASLLLAAFFGILMSNPGSPGIDAVDYAAAADQAQGGIDEPLAAPQLPDGWQANRAELQTGADDVDVWRLGLITAAGDFIGVKQGIDANRTWLAAQVEATNETGSTVIAGIPWVLREGDPDGALARAMTATDERSTFVLYGTADDEEFTQIAEALSEERNRMSRTPAKVWQEMVRGNERFVEGKPLHPRQDVDRRAELAFFQAPAAALFGCSDSRLAAEIIFDKGLGDLFVVRNAGQVVSASVIASLEYAVAVLGVPLIVVLAHDSCGAVQAAIDLQSADAPQLPVHIANHIGPIAPAVQQVKNGAATADAAEVGRVHLRNTVQALVETSELISDAIADGRLAVVGANYRLSEGRAEPDVVIGAV